MSIGEANLPVAGGTETLPSAGLEHGVIPKVVHPWLASRCLR